MTKREQVEYLASYFLWIYESDKIIAVDMICDKCTDEEVNDAYNGVKENMTDYMQVEVVGHYWNILFNKAFKGVR